MRKKRICVMGLGYIGLPTSAVLADMGYFVHGVDVVHDIVKTVNEGRIHIVEPGLDKIVRKAVNSGRLKAATAPIYSDIFVIAVPTPFYDGFVPNTDYIINATKAIAPYVKDGNIVILESTSPIGTTNMIRDILEQSGVNTSKIFLAYCPERVLPGRIIKELIENDRIVGGVTIESASVVADFYREFVLGEVLETDSKTAEMVKLVENSFRDVNIAFANELSMLCDKFDINVWNTISLANRHPRVNILSPSVGVGGHCIAVDPWFLIHSGGGIAKLIKESRMVNKAKTNWVIEKIKGAVLDFERKNNKRPKIACMGLSFKPDIDDLRESPALDVVMGLKDCGFDILAVEPNIKFYKGFDVVEYQDAINIADIVVFLVAHKEFRNINTKTALDFCGVLNGQI